MANVHGRAVLHAASALLLGGSLVDCSRKGPGGAVGTGGEAPRQEPTLGELARGLEGPLLVPGHREYDMRRKVQNRRFDGVYPRAVALCRNAADVSRCIAWSRAAGVPLVPRCGGHDYVGASVNTGLVVSVRDINHIDVDPTARLMHVGAGALLVEIHEALAPHGLMLPTGLCPSVGIAGLTLGGGKGFSTRTYGLTTDNLAEVEMVLASGQVVTAGPSMNADLFWACQGGGGGAFGVVTSFTFRVHPVTSAAWLQVDWGWEDAVEALSVWEDWAHDAPDELFVRAQIARRPDGRDVQYFGQYFGSVADLERLLRPVLAGRGGRRAKVSIGESPYLDVFLRWADCNRGVAPCLAHARDFSQVGAWVAKSDYFRAALPRSAIETLVFHFAKPGLQGESWSGVQLDPQGGAIARIAKDATAFVHREMRSVAQYLVYWDPSASAACVDACRNDLRALYAVLRPFASGECYQNYPDDDLADRDNAYYGSNARQLKEIKRKYDPLGVFAGLAVR